MEMRSLLAKSRKGKNFGGKIPQPEKPLSKYKKMLDFEEISA
jgi:hypothetical protein